MCQYHASYPVSIVTHIPSIIYLFTCHSDLDPVCFYDGILPSFHSNIPHRSSVISTVHTVIYHVHISCTSLMLQSALRYLFLTRIITHI